MFLCLYCCGQDPAAGGGGCTGAEAGAEAAEDLVVIRKELQEKLLGLQVVVKMLEGAAD